MGRWLARRKELRQQEGRAIALFEGPPEQLLGGEEDGLVLELPDAAADKPGPQLGPDARPDVGHHVLGGQRLKRVGLGHGASTAGASLEQGMRRGTAYAGASGRPFGPAGGSPTPHGMDC